MKIRCENCSYYGPKEGFARDLTVAASPSGQYPYICPKCGKGSHYPQELLKALSDKQAFALLEKLKKTVDSGDFIVLELKQEINTLLEYKEGSYRYALDISEFVDYANKKIEEKK